MTDTEPRGKEKRQQEASTEALGGVLAGASMGWGEPIDASPHKERLPVG